MKIVFFGTSRFAVPSLEKLARSRHTVAAVVTQPDKKKGRYLKLSSPPIGEAARDLGIADILQPLKPSLIMRELEAYKADVFVVIAYGHILKPDILALARSIAVNVHSSLLPKYRGAAPINWAVINGEKETGVSIIRMNQYMDAGEVMAQARTVITDDDDARTLDERLSEMGAELLLSTLDSFERGCIVYYKQDDESVIHARKLTKEDGLIDWNDNAAMIHNRIRGLVPWPGAYTYLAGHKLNIWKSQVVAGQAAAGEVVKAGGSDIIVGTGRELLQVNELQLEGKNILKADEFIRGARALVKGVVLGAK